MIALDRDVGYVWANNDESIYFVIRNGQSSFLKSVNPLSSGDEVATSNELFAWSDAERTTTSSIEVRSNGTVVVRGLTSDAGVELAEVINISGLDIEE